MCGRMAITLPTEAMAQLFNATPANDPPHVPNYNVCPTVNVHTVTYDSGTRDPLVVGLTGRKFV